MRIIARAQKNYQEGRQTILFLDEIHRWSKSQQDVLLPWVEKGIITLIGATTENPSFTVINALLSRCRTYILEPITPTEVVEFMEKNMSRIQERYPLVNLLEKGGAESIGRSGGLVCQENISQKSQSSVSTSSSQLLSQGALELIAKLGNGDLRNTLNLLETACILQ